jgi:hypothetical protein
VKYRIKWITTRTQISEAVIDEEELKKLGYNPANFRASGSLTGSERQRALEELEESWGFTASDESRRIFAWTRLEGK